MTRLYEALDGIAGEAPLVDLADRVVTGHRRRRRAVLTMAATIATVTVLGMTTGVVALQEWRGNETAVSRGAGALPELPDGGVEPLSYAYQPPCKPSPDRRRAPDCDAVEWRVVTRGGTTYRVPRALVRTVKDEHVPVAISRDGRMLAYYSRDAQAHVVRDLASGSEVVSPAEVKEERIGVGSMLAVSDDGRHVVFDPREGSKRPGLLIEMRTGRTVPVPGAFEVIGVKDGVAALVRYIKTDLWLMPVTGGGRTVRFKGPFIMFSELAPDGRTVAASDFAMQDHLRSRLTLLDTGTGKVLRRVAIRGLPKQGSIIGVSLWRSGSEVTIQHQHSKITTYAVDVGTGRARRLAGYPDKGQHLTLPGTAGL